MNWLCLNKAQSWGACRKKLKLMLKSNGMLSKKIGAVGELRYARVVDGRKLQIYSLWADCYVNLPSFERH